MTPQEALAILNTAAASAPGTRADHAQAMEAVNVLAATIAEPEPEPEPPAAPKKRASRAKPKAT